MKEKTLSSQKIFDGRIISLRKDEIETDKGLRETREVISHGGGAAGSLRAEAIAAGFYDYRALKTLERRAGRNRVLRLLNEAGVKSFTEYPHSAEKFDALMENVIREIAEA